MATETRSSNGILVFAGSIVALFLVAAILTWQIAAGPKPQDLDLKRATARNAVREKLDQEARTILTSEGWVDKAKGIVRVPVADLYAATATELKGKKPAASQIKVELPLPMPVIDPNATEPPPPALPSSPQGADTIRFAAPAPPAPAVVPTPAAAPTSPPPPTAPAPPAPPTATPVDAALVPAPLEAAPPPPPAHAPPPAAPPVPTSPPAEAVPASPPANPGDSATTTSPLPQ